MTEEHFSFECDGERRGGERRGNADEEVEGRKRENHRFHRTPTTVIRMEVFIVLAAVSLYVAAPTLRVIVQSLTLLPLSRMSND